MTATLSTKGRVTIPKEIRRRHGWNEGTELEIEDRGEAVVIRARVDVPATTLADVLGCLAYKGSAKTIAEMDAAVTKLARGRPPGKR